QAIGQNMSRTYYVSTLGSDANDGSRMHPFQTVDKINKLRLSAGDTVFFIAGQTFNGTLSFDSGTSGSKKDPIVITSFGNGSATIDAKDSAGIKLHENSYFKLQHIKLVASGRKTGNTKDGLSIANCKEIAVDDMDISGFQKSGLLIFSSQNVTVDNIFT